MTVFAFDVDGTISTSSGPVTVGDLKKLQEYGCVVVIVSPSSLKPAGFEEMNQSDRLTNLREVRLRWPGHVFYFYVSNNQDWEVAKQAKFMYIEARDFVVI